MTLAEAVDRANAKLGHDAPTLDLLEAARAELGGAIEPSPEKISRLTIERDGWKKQFEDACGTSLRFRERLMRAEKAIAKARKFMRSEPEMVADAYAALDWRNR